MSSDSSDSEEPGRCPRKNKSDSDNDSIKAQTNPNLDGSKGPRTPGSPRSPHSRSRSGSPPGIRSPSPSKSPSSSSPLRRSVIRSPSNSPMAIRSPPRSPSNSPTGLRSGPRSPSNSPSGLRSAPRSPSRSPSRSLSRSPIRERGPRSPPENLDDDGRSNISSGSSILSGSSKKDEVNGHVEKPKSSPLAKSHFSVPNAEDLSDVSDIDDSDGLADDSKSVKSEEPVRTIKRRSPEMRREVDKRGKRDNIHMDDGEQLDFEAEDQPEIEREDGELEAAPVIQEKKREKDKEREEGEEKSGDEGEVKEDGAESLEEGEVTDEGDPKPEKPPICRFYSRGACTWGSNCRFLHPGVTDKGNYSMFEVTRPMVAPPNGLGMYHPEPRPYPIHIPPTRVMAGPYTAAVRREEPPGVESAWERGLRQAKELMRKSNKRKETDMDFEEKKMNLSIGQDEMDKENDYYTRVASPMDDTEAWDSRISPKVDPEARRPAVRVVERYEDIIPESPAVYDRYDYRRGYDKVRDPEYMLRREKKYYTEEELLARKAGKKMVREVIVQRMDRPGERAERGKRPPSEGGRRPDEWLDPWMRSKSPGGRKGQPHRPRKVSYTSGSSSFSGSSSRSSSNSSYSSYSRSRSGSRSGTGSPSPSRPRRPRSPPAVLAGRAKPLEARDAKFKPLKAGAPPDKAVAERPLLMNPPAPSPRRIKERPLSPSAAMRKVGLNPPAPTPKVARPSQKHGPKVRGRKSRSSSSGSSGSSSESTHSSYSSSSSSSIPGSPPGRVVKKLEPDERLAAASLKGKGLDVLKITAQKPPMKLTLKPSESKREKPGLPPMIAGKKRPAEEPPAADPREPSPSKLGGGKKASSRREELLKQLKAVEDAIARKRSKI